MAKVGMVFIILKKMDLGNSYDGVLRATGLPQADGLELQQPSFIKDNVKILPNRNYIPTWILCKCWNF
jgi:hypothetical protein